MYERHFRRSSEGRDSLEGKRNYQDQILVNLAATTGRFSEWVGVFLEKRLMDVSCGNLSMVVGTRRKEFIFQTKSKKSWVK